MTRPLPPPAAYAPDATGDPTRWPWVLDLGERLPTHRGTHAAAGAR